MAETETLTELLERKRYKFDQTDDGLTVTYNGNVDLRSLTTLPENTKFENHGNVDLRSLTTLPENTKFENHGYVNLRSLTTLPENTKFENHGNVYLESLTTLPENTKFENHGNVYLRSLTTLPENTKFENHGNVLARSLDHKSILYRGKRRAIRHIDGSTMIVTSTKQQGGATVMRARYFKGGEVGSMPKCYIAQIGEYYAHGDTIKQALSDARFKHLQATMDTSGVVEEIKTAGHFTRETFRILTGACASGTERFLSDHGLADKETLSIAETVRVTRCSYGGDVISEHFAHMIDEAA